MTTEVPQHPVYPTAPPWATATTPEAPDAPPPAYGAVAPYGSPLPPHGGLLVPFPEEMHNAVRPKPPALWPIAPFTFLLLIPGLVSAGRRAAQARRGRNSAAPYWITFVVSLVGSFFLWSMIGAVTLPMAQNYLEGRITQQVEHNLVHDGQLAKTSNVTVTAAKCEPVGPRAADAQRAYDCLLTLDDGSTGTLTVRADTDGDWTAAPAPKAAKTK
jgi:hypothetical protein